MTASTNIKAALFDLDDTLVDHQHSSRCGLLAVQTANDCFAGHDILTLEQAYQSLIGELHSKVMAGELTLDDARRQRFLEFLKWAGSDVDREQADAAAELYRQTYNDTQRLVPGAHELLESLRPEIRIGIVTNHVRAEQLKKIDRCKLNGLFESLVVSEDVGAPKPDPLMFQTALKELNCGASEAVMIGDSWEADIEGATALGIRSVWLNRYGHECPDPTTATEINSLEPIDRIRQLILSE